MEFRFSWYNKNTNMPIIVAQIIRTTIQMAVTLGLIELANRTLLPVLNKAISAVMQVFGVSEETAKDIIANEYLQFAEQIGIGVLALRSKLPVTIAERLGFTSKGWNRRPIITPKAKIVPSASEASMGASAMKAIL